MLTSVAVAVAGCNSAGDPPVSEWSRAPLRPDDVRRDAQNGHGSGHSGLRLGGRAGRAETILGSGRFVGSSRARKKADDAADEDGVTLNLVNLPISDAAKVVLGDIVGADYVVDPRLEGKVTVHTSKPVKKAAAIDLFQSSLRVAGALIVDTDGVYKIVPADQAATSGARLSVGAAPAARAEQIGSGVRVVQLHYVSAAEMKRVLEPISQRGGIVQADESRRMLTLGGTAQEVAALEEAISIFDVDAMRGMSFAMVPVRSADPDTLSEDLRKVFGSEKEGPMNGMIQFVGNKHLAAILVISSQRAYLSRARAWIERLDARAESTEKQFFSYRVQNRPAKELVRVLSAMFGRDNGASGNDASPRFGQSSASLGGALSQSGLGSSGSSGSSSALGSLGSSSNSSGSSGGLGSGSSSLGNSSGSASSSSSKFGSAGSSSSSDQNGSQSGSGQDSAVSDDGRYKFAVDDAKNAIVVLATPEDYKRVLKVVETLDVLPNQVFIEATIAEVTLNDDLSFGVRWFLQKNASMGAFSDGDTGTPAANDTLGNNLLGAAVGAAFPGFAYAVRAANTQVTLSALNQITNVNIISTPSLTVLDNRQAVLQVGDQVPVTTLTGANTNGGVTTFNSVNYRDTGVILSITPHINESGRVMLELEQEVSNVASGTSATSTTPTIKQRRVKTQVVVNDSESLMLGGLIQDSSSRGSSQIPVIGDIPLFGNAFKSKTNSAGKTELLIMITPHVVRTLAEARDITDEFKRKMLHISTKAIVRPHSWDNTARRMLLDDR
ncbi:type II secretion system protein GspD [Methylosinus sp. 3S-1]|nr:type II secretion system protein GspD [Methylosinus sp. 3S-1]